MNATAPIETANSSTLEIEQGLLGACLSYSQAVHVALAHVEAEHFIEPTHKLIWQTIDGLVSEGRVVSPVTIGAVLGNPDLGQGVTMRQYIARLASDTWCPANAVVDFAKQIRSAWALRCIASDGEMLRSVALQPNANPSAIISDFIQELDGIRAALDRRRGGARHVSQGVADIVDRIERRRVGEIIDSAASTGLRDLDRKLGGGFKPGELILIAGRPGMGKTVLGASMARQMAKTGLAGGFFSLEMPEAQICARMACDEVFGTGRLTANQILQDTLSDADAEMVADAERSIKTLPLRIDDSSSLTVGEVGARTRVMRNQFEREGKSLGFIVIDYLKFLRASDRYRGQRHYEVGEISGGLKALAKDLSIPVILLVQLNREVEKRSEKRPELADIRESGDLEADADTVLLLFREAYYLSSEAKKDDDAAARLQDVQFKLEIIIAKQRMGPTGFVDVFFHPASSAVRDMDGRH